MFTQELTDLIIGLDVGKKIDRTVIALFEKYQEYEALKEELRERAPISDAEMEELRARVAELEAEIRELEQAAEVAEEASAMREQQEQKRLIREMLR